MTQVPPQKKKKKRKEREKEDFPRSLDAGRGVLLVGSLGTGCRSATERVDHGVEARCLLSTPTRFSL